MRFERGQLVKNTDLMRVGHLARIIGIDYDPGADDEDVLYHVAVVAYEHHSDTWSGEKIVVADEDRVKHPALEVLRSVESMKGAYADCLENLHKVRGHYLPQPGTTDAGRCRFLDGEIREMQAKVDMLNWVIKQFTVPDYRCPKCRHLRIHDTTKECPSCGVALEPWFEEFDDV